MIRAGEGVAADHVGRVGVVQGPSRGCLYNYYSVKLEDGQPTLLGQLSMKGGVHQFSADRIVPILCRFDWNAHVASSTETPAVDLGGGRTGCSNVWHGPAFSTEVPAIDVDASSVKIPDVFLGALPAAVATTDVGTSSSNNSTTAEKTDDGAAKEDTFAHPQFSKFTSGKFESLRKHIYAELHAARVTRSRRSASSQTPSS